MKINVDTEDQGVWLEVISELDDDFSFNVWLTEKETLELIESLELAAKGWGG